MSEKIEPCAWCRKEPDPVMGTNLWVHKCALLTVSDLWAFTQDEWNELQPTILTARRKDFKAGWLNGESDWETGEFVPTTFDDYLKETK